MADLMNLPPLPQLIVAKCAGFVTMSYTARSVEALESAREARERILLARIAELVEALEASTEIMARMYGPQAESLPPVVRNRKAIDAARKACKV